jgi:hypothetical protein
MFLSAIVTVGVRCSVEHPGVPKDILRFGGAGASRHDERPWLTAFDLPQYRTQRIPLRDGGGIVGRRPCFVRFDGDSAAFDQRLDRHVRERLSNGDANVPQILGNRDGGHSVHLSSMRRLPQVIHEPIARQLRHRFESAWLLE